MEKNIKEIARDKNKQNLDSYELLIDIIESNPDLYKEYFDKDGEINVEKLQETIDEIGNYEDKYFIWDTKPYAKILFSELSLRILLEHSGSMNGYDARECSGDFKHAINEVVNRFPNNDSILIVNSVIEPYVGSSYDFVQDRNIFETTKDVGDPSYTDFRKIFNYALSQVEPGRITMLVTDMIYSPEGTEGVTAEKLRNEELSLMSQIGKETSSMSMLIVKLNSDFIGKYYPYNSPRDGVTYKGKRPYYMIFIGRNRDLNRMLSRPKYANLRDFASLPGFEHYYYLGREPFKVGYYSLLPRTKDDRGLYAISKSAGSKNLPICLTDIEPDSQGGFTFSVAVDLSRIGVEEQYILNPAHWQTSMSQAKVKSVQPITDDMRNPQNNRYIGSATHVLHLEANKNLKGNLYIKLINSIPAWVAESSSTDDRDLKTDNFGSTTFGFADMVQGLYNGLYGTAKAPDYVVYMIEVK